MAETPESAARDASGKREEMEVIIRAWLTRQAREG